MPISLVLMARIIMRMFNSRFSVVQSAYVQSAYVQSLIGYKFTKLSVKNRIGRYRHLKGVGNVIKRSKRPRK